MIAAPLVLAVASVLPAGEELLLLRFRARAVDGVDELRMRGREASIRHVQWQPIEGLEIEVLNEIDDPASRRIVVRARRGRPAVSVFEQPSADNDNTLRVRIDDGPHGGAAPLEFELWALPAKPAPRPFDVVVITIDTLRPDHLGCYGYARPTSPNLDAFAAGATRFTNAFSTSSFTPPSHASMLTSRAVGDHGLLTWNALPEKELTLAEILLSHGYRTGASVNLGLLSEQNLGQGFEMRREGARDARSIVDDALAFLREPDGRPVFLWLHLYDVHRPYGRTAGWAERFARAPRAGIGDVEAHYNLTPEHARERALTDADLSFIADRYDAGIAYTDAELGPLLAELATPARKARTLVVVTADHGESLREHAERAFSHDPFLFASVTRVPLLVRHPDGLGAESVRADLASLIDIAPTVLTTLGIEAPPSFAGRSLRAPPAPSGSDDRIVHHECWGWERLAAARTSQWLALRDLKRGRTQLFALAEDPGESKPLDPSTRPEAAALLRDLDAFVARRAIDEEPPPLDPALERRLRELGYVGDDE